MRSTSPPDFTEFLGSTSRLSPDAGSIPKWPKSSLTSFPNIWAVVQRGPPAGPLSGSPGGAPLQQSQGLEMGLPIEKALT